MSGRGNPIRFLALVLGGWVLLRATTLLPQPGSPGALQQPARPLAAIAAGRPAIPQAMMIASHAPIDSGLLHIPRRDQVRMVTSRPSADPQRVALALLAMMRFGTAEPVMQGAVAPSAANPTINTPADSGTKQNSSASRWSGSFWLIARDGRGLGASLSGSQLGGSQTGVRLAYALGTARRVAVVGRIASPLSGTGQEAAFGVEWRPTRLPVRLVAEQRIGINGAEGGPSLGLVGGAGPLPVGEGFRLEGYGQAGMIKRAGIIGYADGSVRINRQVAMIGDSPIDVGGGGWGAIQPGAARLDLGPSIGARLPIGANRVRLSLDWRQRVAGSARPGSGPALSIGADF